jgi:hypothetical protein
MKPAKPQVLSDILLLVGVQVPPEQVARWSDGQRLDAERWASAVHLDASDNTVKVPPKPEFLQFPVDIEREAAKPLGADPRQGGLL